MGCYLEVKYNSNFELCLGFRFVLLFPLPHLFALLLMVLKIEHRACSMPSMCCSTELYSQIHSSSVYYGKLGLLNCDCTIKFSEELKKKEEEKKNKEKVI